MSCCFLLFDTDLHFRYSIPAGINICPRKKFIWVLDLQGGMHLLMEIDTDKALESMIERTSNDLKESLMESKVRFRNVEKTKGATISLGIDRFSR